MEQKLKADRRDGAGKGVARKIRAQGRIPAVVYGHGIEPLPISVDARDLFHVLHTDAGANVLVDLRVDGEHFLAMPREIQRDHLLGRFIHVDFLRIARDEKIKVEVPIHLVGESRGVKEGGVVEHHIWNLELESFPQDVPTSVEANISGLGINESLSIDGQVSYFASTLLETLAGVQHRMVFDLRGNHVVARLRQSEHREIVGLSSTTEGGQAGAEGAGQPES